MAKRADSDPCATLAAVEGLTHRIFSLERALAECLVVLAALDLTEGDGWSLAEDTTWAIREACGTAAAALGAGREET